MEKRRNNGCDLSDEEKLRGRRRRIGGFRTIHPNPTPDYHYPPYELINLAKKAIQTYNDHTGSSYNFVKLEEAVVHKSPAAHSLRINFKAALHDDQPKSHVITFKTSVYKTPTPDGSNVEIYLVSPLHSESGFDISRLTIFKNDAPSASPSQSSQAEMLRTQVEQVQISC